VAKRGFVAAGRRRRRAVMSSGPICENEIRGLYI